MSVASKPLRPFEEERKAKDGENEEVEEEQVQKDEKKIREERELGRDEPPPLPRYLHKTRSLFMRNIPPSICKEEIVNVSLTTHTHTESVPLIVKEVYCCVLT